LHRPSNVDRPELLSVIMRKLAKISNKMPVIFPVHPRTNNMLKEINFRAESYSRLMLIEPVGYTDSLWLAKYAFFVLTDSGGLQEETTFFKTPCLTLRPNTERPITIRLGTNKLTRLDNLESDIEEIISGKIKRGTIPKYWDGKTAERIIKHLIAA
ncbi:MAG: UDP-N-acetylglucosamine 2-epimerase, partial [Tepidanaerobacteraceae bacterium]|nr:UDP-N-acetylglucosamine 2-epimerase [Tepidanaerobacteraceae bacterium]